MAPRKDSAARRKAANETSGTKQAKAATPTQKKKQANKATAPARKPPVSSAKKRKTPTTPPAKAPPKRGRGRPRKALNEKSIALLARFGCTVKEIAAEFQVSTDTLERNYAAALKGGRERLALSLKRKQVQVALKDGAAGQATMLVWLGKQYLGQRDNRDGRISADGFQPIAALPANHHIPSAPES